MLDFEEQLREAEERDEWTARVLGRFQLAWANIERDIRTLWLMQAGENEFRRQDTQTLQERRKRLPRQFQKLVECTVPDRELPDFWLFPEDLRNSPKCAVPGGNLRTWLLKNWPTRNLVIHGSVGLKIDFGGPSVPYIADTDDTAMMQAAEHAEKAVSSQEAIYVQDLVPLTEEAQQVKFFLMLVHMMVSRNGVGRFPLQDPACPQRAGAEANEPLPAGRMT